MNKPDWYDNNKAINKQGVEEKWEDLKPDLQKIIYSHHYAGLAMNDEDLLTAMKLLQEMRESEEFCCIDIQSDYHFVWDLSFVHENWTNEKGHIKRKIPGSFDRLSDAIRKFHRLWKEGKLEEETI